MKKITLLFGILIFASCGESKKTETVVVKKVVCGDSIEQEMFDEQGNAIYVKVPGKCDTVLESAGSEK